MTKVSEFIASLAQTGKVQDVAVIKTFLSSPITADTEVPKELIDAHNVTYLTIDGAKNNADIKSHFFGTALSTADAKLESVMSVLGFSDDQKKLVKEADGTFKRIEKLGEITKGLIANASTSTDKQKLTDEITKLNSELAGKDKALAEKLSEVSNASNARLRTLALNQTFSLQPLFTSDSQTLEDTMLLANNKLQKALTEKKAELSFDPNTLTFKLHQAGNVDLAYFENNKEVSFDDFRNKVLAESKLLKVTSSQTTAVSNGNGNSQQQRTNGTGQQTMRDTNFNKNIDADLENLRQSTTA